MKKVKWLGVKNTEREAIRKHGDEWLRVNSTTFNSKGKPATNARGAAFILIESPDKTDQRWIKWTQVVARI